MKQIKGYPDYFITEYGSVFSQKSGKNLKKLKSWRHRQGYLRVEFSGINGRSKKLVHRLVGEAFIPNPESKRTINHKNGIKTDNRVSNLEWNTHSENTKHAFSTLGKKVKKGKESPHSRKVFRIDKKNGKEILFGTLREGGQSVGKSATGCTNICLTCRGKRKSAYGYYWRYAKEGEK